MMRIFLLLALSWNPAAWAEDDSDLPEESCAEVKPECQQFMPEKGPTGQGPVKNKAEMYRYVLDCSRGKNWLQVDQSPSMRRFLSGMGKLAGQNIPVYSCHRAQESQDFILCNLSCAPRFGNVQCNGRMASNLSSHTYAIAADFTIKSKAPNLGKCKTNTGPEANAEIEAACRLLDKARKQFNGGRGGLSVYGITGNQIYMHFDEVEDWCNWGACAKLLGTAGHCKRATFKRNQAAFESEIAKKELLQDEAAVNDLTEKLAELRKSCPPGDMTCIDSYKKSP